MDSIMSLLDLPSDCIGVIVGFCDIFAANALLQTCAELLRHQIEKNYELTYSTTCIVVEYPLYRNSHNRDDQLRAYFLHSADDRYSLLLTNADSVIHIAVSVRPTGLHIYANRADLAQIRGFMDCARLLPRDFAAILSSIKID